MERIFFAIFFGLALYGAIHQLPLGYASGEERVKLDSYKYDYGEKARSVRSEEFVICDECEEPSGLTLIKKTPQVKKRASASQEIISKSTAHKVTVYFKFASFSLSQMEKAKLDRLIEAAKKSERYIVTGYTCDIGTMAQNDFYAYKRAGTIAEYLSDSGLVVEARAKPKCCYVDRVNGPKNRRAEIEIINKSINEGEIL